MATGGFTLSQPAGTGGLNFGTGQSAATAGGGGFSITQPAQPVATSATGLGFGTPTAAATGGGISFGTPASSSSGSIGLGMPAASSALTPSASTVMAGGGLLATPSSVSSSGFGFGASTALPSTVEGSSLGMAPPLVSSGLPLAGTATTSGSGGFPFTPSATTSTVNTAASTTSSVGTGFSFGTPVTANSTKMGFSLGTTTSTTQSSATTGLTLGQATTATTSTSGSGFSFGPTTTSSSISSFLSTPATPASSAASLTPSATIGLGGTAPTLQAAPSIGLGGAQPAPGQAGVNTAGQKPDGKSTKEIPLPQDIFATLAVFEGHMNGEKAASEHNMRKTAAPFHKLDEETKKMRQLVTQLANQYTQLSSSAEKLKAQVMQEAKHVEMARRTQDTPVGLQTENKAREEYFAALVHSFEQRMIYCRTKIEEVERCLQATNNSSTTPDDVKEVMRREHDTMKALAGQVYQLHTKLLLLCDQVKSSAVPSPQALFRPQPPAPKSQLPPSAELRPCLGGGGSALKEFQAGQQKAKAWSLGAAPPTLPLSQTSAPSLFGSSTNTGQKGVGLFGSNQVFSSTPLGPCFGSGSLFSPATSSAFGASNTLSSNTANQSSLFNFSSSFNSKPFGW